MPLTRSQAKTQDPPSQTSSAAGIDKEEVKDILVQSPFDQEDATDNPYFVTTFPKSASRSHFTSVCDLVTTLQDHCEDLQIIKIAKPNKNKDKVFVTGIKFAPLVCMKCIGSDFKYENTRELVIHLVNSHFPEARALVNCGLINEDVQKALEEAVKRQKDKSFFQKSFSTVSDYVLKCPLNSPVLKFIFDAPILIYLDRIINAHASVIIPVMDENHTKRAVGIVYDNFLRVQNAAMMKKFYWRFDGHQTHSVNVENDIDNKWSEKEKKYLASALQILGDTKKTREKKLGETFRTIEVVFNQNVPMGFRKRKLSSESKPVKNGKNSSN